MAKIQYTLNKKTGDNNIPPAIKEMMLSGSLDKNEQITIELSKKDIRRFFKDESKKLKKLLRRSN